MIRLVALIALALVAGCKERNSQFCDNPDNGSDPDCNGIDAPTTCASSAECGDQVCKLPEGVCVQCTPEEPAACSGTTPLCDGSTNSCVGCEQHAECSSTSNVCLPDGACADETMVAYVAPMANGTECTKAAPCGTLADALATNKLVIKFAAGVVADDQKTTIGNRTDLTILAELGAKLDRTTDGTILEVTGTSDVAIFDLEITGASGVVEAALSMPAGTARLALHRVKVTNSIGPVGISVASNQAFSMDRCIVSGNSGGGASIQNVDFTLTNNIFVKNGSGITLSNGLELKPASAAHVFEFNTVASNTTDVGENGVLCLVTVNARNNIIADDTTSSSCNFEFTLFPVGTDVTGTTNKAGDADFINQNATNPLAPDYFRIGANSAAKDSADPASTIEVDLDGDVRPATGKDMGADEAQ
jgi:hypothetical protein